MQSSLAVGKCLAGWKDCHAPVSLPKFRCLNIDQHIIDKLIDELVLNSFDEFRIHGRLRPVLEASLASMIMYDIDIIRDLGVQIMLPVWSFVGALKQLIRLILGPTV